jgi:hypothetical protein
MTSFATRRAWLKYAKKCGGEGKCALPMIPWLVFRELPQIIQTLRDEEGSGAVFAQVAFGDGREGGD